MMEGELDERTVRWEAVTLEFDRQKDFGNRHAGGWEFGACDCDHRFLEKLYPIILRKKNYNFTNFLF